MAIEMCENKYARLLRVQGHCVITVGDVDWYDHSGFMIPAYLPHCCPQITPEMAKEVIQVSGKPFARWDRQFGKLESSEWWWLLRRGPWAIDTIGNKKKRWMIRQGKKRFSVRPMGFDEVLCKCPTVAQAATARYKGHNRVETYKVLQERLKAARKVPNILEYVGAFQENTLVGFSENYIQDNAVWLASIRHNPAFLKAYSSYALVDGLLDYYLNEKKMDYVLDGWRSTHHRTQFQDHLIRVFGFSKEYSILDVAYSPKFKLLVNLAYPFRHIFWPLSRKYVNTTLDNICAVLRQEHIRKACASL